MAEAWVATFKAELVAWVGLTSYERVEHETLAWIRFYNTERLHEALGDVPPAEFETTERPDSPGEHPAQAPAPAEIDPRSLGASGHDRIEREVKTPEPTTTNLSAR